MPKLSEWYIKLSLLYLLAGFTMGALMLAHKGIRLVSGLMSLLSLHVEYVLVGWTIQLAMGVAYWMFPRFTPEKTGMKVRGYETAARAALVFLNLGLLSSTLGYVVGDPTWFPLVGRFCEAVGVVSFLLNIWPRIKPVSQP